MSKKRAPSTGAKQRSMTTKVTSEVLPLGLVLASAALVFICAYGGHEFKWKEVAIMSVVLVIFSVLVFVKGLSLPFPICPDFIEVCPIR